MLSLIMDGCSRTTSTFDLQYVVNMQRGLEKKKKDQAQFRTPASSIKVCKSAIRSGQSSRSELMAGEIDGRMTKGEEKKLKQGNEMDSSVNGFRRRAVEQPQT